MSTSGDGREREEAKGPQPLGSTEFEEIFGEPISEALDVSTWQTGVNLDELYNRIGDEQDTRRPCASSTV